MGVQVAGSSLHWSQLMPTITHPASSQTLASLVRSKRTASPFLGSGYSKLARSRSMEMHKHPRKRGSKEPTLRRAFSASLDSFLGDSDEDEEEFVRRIQELVEESNLDPTESRNRKAESSRGDHASTNSSSSYSSSSAWSSIWPDQDSIVPASLERKANSVDLPLSLRIIKRKKKLQLRWEEGFREAGESARCSVNKAFSSMVFIIRELQSYALMMRESLLYEDLKGVLAHVQHEMHASFVWLFQHIFSCTPTLMISLMLLLANFTVYSMGNNVAAAAAAVAAQTTSHAKSAVAAVVVESPHSKSHRPLFDPAPVKTFSIGGNGGGKVRRPPVAADDGPSDGSHQRRAILPEQISTVAAAVSEEGGGIEEGQTAQVVEEDEATVWNRVLEEASRMQGSLRHESLTDPEVLKRLVSPVTVELEVEESKDYLRRDLMYQEAVSKDPDNSLLLSNFAQLLYIVLHDHDRAEHYFKRAIRVEPADAESLCRYATFLWVVKKDLEAAEETYLEAIAADPGNSHYAANYAHFLWSTGGEDTCYPLD
ncbi:uncharacterized protein [Typha latifolia]|uniref:uncharacterized protein n=1 Tax=Typha latifolia TaxID=4733 RepID=UPI003C2DD800